MRDNDGILLGVLLFTNLLSLLDGYLTLLEVSAGIASEGNPVLASLFEIHPWAAIGFKTSMMVLVSAIIWSSRRLRVMLVLSVFACAVFTAVVAYHLGSLAGLGLA